MNSTSDQSRGIYPIKRGLADEFGTIAPGGHRVPLTRANIGMDVPGWWEPEHKDEKRKREPYPAGHRYFRDCLRESISRQIVQLVNQRGLQGWFCTRT